MLYTDRNQWSKRNVVSYELASTSEYPAIDIDAADHLYFVWRQDGDYQGAGADGDVFFRKYGGPPQQPFLRPLIPRTTETGNVYLRWEPVPGIDNYDIYRSTAFITSIEGMTPIYTNYDTDHAEILTAEDTYYYVIVAENEFGDSLPSNCEYITYEEPSLREFAIVGSLLAGLSITAIVFTRIKKKK